MNPIAKIDVADEVPWAEAFTPYDRAQFTLYMRLLNALNEQAQEEEICKELLGIDAKREPERARRCLDSHLRRARWFRGEGLRFLTGEA